MTDQVIDLIKIRFFIKIYGHINIRTIADLCTSQSILLKKARHKNTGSSTLIGNAATRCPACPDKYSYDSILIIIHSIPIFCFSDVQFACSLFYLIKIGISPVDMVKDLGKVGPKIFLRKLQSVTIFTRFCKVLDAIRLSQ
jgi:hypothetical protein